MLTRMTTTRAIVLKVFEAPFTPGHKGRDDRNFLEALHYFSVKHQLACASCSIWQLEQRLERSGD